jgi:hypothetical protein
MMFTDDESDVLGAMLDDYRRWAATDGAERVVLRAPLNAELVLDALNVQLDAWSRLSRDEASLLTRLHPFLLDLPPQTFALAALACPDASPEVHRAIVETSRLLMLELLRLDVVVVAIADAMTRVGVGVADLPAVPDDLPPVPDYIPAHF